MEDEQGEQLTAREQVKRQFRPSSFPFNCSPVLLLTCSIFGHVAAKKSGRHDLNMRPLRPENTLATRRNSRFPQGLSAFLTAVAQLQVVARSAKFLRGIVVARHAKTVVTGARKGPRWVGRWAWVISFQGVGDTPPIQNRAIACVAGERSTRRMPQKARRAGSGPGGRGWGAIGPSDCGQVGLWADLAVLLARR